MTSDSVSLLLMRRYVTQLVRSPRARAALRRIGTTRQHPGNIDPAQRNDGHRLRAAVPAAPAPVVDVMHAEPIH